MSRQIVFERLDKLTPEGVRELRAFGVDLDRMCKDGRSFINRWNHLFANHEWRVYGQDILTRLARLERLLLEQPRDTEH